jgi:hypothetical protein
MKLPIRRSVRSDALLKELVKAKLSPTNRKMMRQLENCSWHVKESVTVLCRVGGYDSSSGLGFFFGFGVVFIDAGGSARDGFSLGMCESETTGKAGGL